MNMKEIMRKAHRIAKKMEGDYVARMSYALKEAWDFYKRRASRNATVIKTVKYCDYKNNCYEAFETVKNSYNSANKTIDIIVPADEDKMNEKRVSYAVGDLYGASLYNDIKCAVKTSETISEAITKVMLKGANTQFNVKGIFKMLGYVK